MQLLSLALAGITAVQGQNFPSVSDVLAARSAFPNLSAFAGQKPQVSRGGSTVCVSSVIKVTAATSQNLKFNYTLPVNQTQVTQTSLDIVTPALNYTNSITQGYATVNGTYDIGATLCLPTNTSTTKIQVLTHGIGFDRYYWDFAPGYSYVDVAAAAGYATFLYDRLGVGLSSKEDALTTVQSPLQLEILEVLVSKLRSGAFGQSFSKVIGVGHSFGSALTEGITAKYPRSLDAAILTGFTLNSTGLPGFLLGNNLAIATNNNPYRFANLSSGYLVGSSAISAQTNFFHFPGFDPSVAALAAATGGTVTFGELFTITAPVMPATNYTGAVAFVAGLQDLPFCFGRCDIPTNLLTPAAAMLYPNQQTSQIGTFLAPNSGHGINLHYSSTAAFAYITSFLQGRGL